MPVYVFFCKHERFLEPVRSVSVEQVNEVRVEGTHHWDAEQKARQSEHVRHPVVYYVQNLSNRQKV